MLSEVKVVWVAETREQWLEEAVRKLRPLFHEIKVQLPEVRVSIGWPSKGGTSTKTKVVGQCWKGSVSKDGVSQIFISPTMGDDPIYVLGVLVHELIHAWDNCESGHKGLFATTARAIGLEGKLTETHVSDDLCGELMIILGSLGELPHSPLVLSEMDKQRKPQTTRMLKLVVTDCCDYTVRTTQKWVDEGLPMCPHGVTMEQA